ncbi:MAG TPA: dihydrofolate reductase, partial [Rubrivivax sp.]|nr:dihydrofolate reductase [Rubrivivax sp.]
MPAVNRPAEIVIIAAVARNGASGRGNALLFTEPADQRHFRQATLGCPVIMGRKTWDSLPARFRPPPGRRNVVVSRNAGLHAEGAEVAPDLDTALARVADAPRAFVIG